MSALRLVLSGEIYVPPLILKEPVAATPAEVTPMNGGIAELTERQVDVLRLLCQGLSNKEIGRALHVAERTVKAHVTAIFRSLHVVNRSQAIAAAQQANLI
jgi:DNA-binding NarL/FixJ family response regulator